MRVLYTLLAFMLWGLSPAYADEPLTLDEAIALSGQADPALQQIESKTLALKEQSVADGQLADPKVTFALQSFPTDNLSTTREGMTQVVAGVSQAFPRGDTLDHKSAKTEAMANIERARYEDQRQQIKLAVRQSWLDLYYWQQALKTVDESKKLLKKVIKATEAAYGTGRQNTQDIIGAELELSILQDKQVDISRQLETAQAELAKWIGTAAKLPVAETFPVLTAVLPYEVLQNDLVSHPKVKAAEAMIEAGNQEVKIAEEQYKPGFNVGLNYGLRNGNLANGEDRPDFVTAMVTLDVPLFPKKRQDKQLSARKYEVASANFMRDDALRTLNAMLETSHANWTRLGERVRRYETDIIRKSQENFKASLRAYQENRADFSALMRAQVMEVDAKLQRLKLRTDQAKAQAFLLYLQGDAS